MLTLSHESIDDKALRAEYNLHTAGALVVFEGIVRNFSMGHEVTRLEYEVTPALAVAEYECIVQEASRHYPLIWIRCVHRIGLVYPGETAVWLGVATGHRAEAFDACRYLIDHVKARLPIWKKEHYTNGDSGWINAP